MEVIPAQQRPGGAHRGKQSPRLFLVSFALPAGNASGATAPLPRRSLRKTRFIG
jgi:hypothetical protein